MPASHVAASWTVVNGDTVHQGEVIVARAWQPDFDAPFASPSTTFRLVLLTGPLAPYPAPLTNPQVLCVTARGVVFPSTGPPGDVRAARETAPPYGSVARIGEVALSLEQAQQFLAFGEAYLAARDYIDEATLPLGEEELAVDRASLLAQLEPGYLLDHPEVWPSVVASYDWFRARYAVLYGQFHQGYQTDLAQARALLHQVQDRVEALRWLNSLSQLGPAVGTEALLQWGALLGGSSPCAAHDGVSEAVPALPFCRVCELRVGVPSPNVAAHKVVDALDAALRVQLRRLSSETVRRVLATSAWPRLERFLAMLQASDTSSLVMVLDADLTDFLRSLLAEELALPTNVPLLAQLREQFEVVEEEQVQEVVHAFERLLYQALEQARREHPDRSARLRLE